MPLTPELIALVTDKVGRFNTDILSGWEVGLMGQRRIAGKLFDRYPPPHLTGPRLCDWYEGRDAGRQQKQLLCRETHFISKGIMVIRKGWVARGKVVTQMEKAGAYGDVTVLYLENGSIKRTVMCAI